ncbi:hypothetical protein BLNAU_19903 [Blattamonas nauphoetae]|uniref:Uncharacterized protein n=1 Tax=Blattamonas nauphoetae TaxID=2049346 RepID=A0ABQ9X072_9EUKA|nr:hypothetical protein BLNAU_19903 [Blattamonas nauphoetae]
MIVSSGNGIRSGIETLKSLDSLCMGLKSFLRNEEQSKKTTETKKNEEKKDESESQFSVVNRSRAALSEIEWTLRSMIVDIGREEERGEEIEGRREISEKIGGMLIRHFPSSFVGLGEKKEGVIGMDIGRLRFEMEENEKRREKERRKEREEIEAERRKEKERIEEERKMEREEIARKEEERRKEFDRQMTELKAERETNQQFIKEGLERQKKKREKEEERKRRSKVGAAAIEFFVPSNYSLSGNKFTKQLNAGGCLVFFEFGGVVARLSLIVGSVPQSYYIVGIISSALAANAQTTCFNGLKGGAGGWDIRPSHRVTFLNTNFSNQYQACHAGAAGQRVVLEADGREGRRTLRMSQDGETQPAFFTNIPVPFRFAVYICNQNDSVTIESVEVVDEPQMIGGTIPVQM